MQRKTKTRPALALLRLAPVALLGLGACAAIMGRTVEGKMLHRPETFIGTSTASIGGSGRLEVVSDKGVKCGGPYRQVADDNPAEVGADSSEVKLTCDDGRTGSVRFLVGQGEAVGTGMLGQDIVTLTIE